MKKSTLTALPFALPFVLLLAACGPAGAPPDAVVASAAETPAPAGDAAAAAGVPSLGNYLAGRIALQDGDFEAASGFMAEALVADPENTDLIAQALLADIGAGEGARAVSLAKRLRAAEGDAPLARILLGAEALAAENTVAAERHFQALGETGVEGVLRPLAIGWARAASGATDAALEALAPLLNSGGAGDLGRIHAALILADGGETERAMMEFAQLRESGRLPLRFAQVIGGFYEDVDQADEAAAVYAAYLENAPESVAFEDPATAALDPVDGAIDGLAEGLFAIASILNQERGGATAMVYARLALHLRPDLDVAQMLVAELHSGAERHERAVALYRAVAPDSPLAWTARLRVADGLKALDRLEQAADLLEAMAGERTDRFDMLFQLGGYYRAAERFDAAASVYDRALARIDPVEPRHWTVFYARGIAHERAKVWEAAEADLLRALELNPDQPYVLNYLGYSWVDQGVHLDRAMEMIEKAVEQRPEDGFIVDSLGWAYYRLGEYEKATLHLERAVALEPRDPTINDHLGDALWRVGRRQEALFQWRRALTMEPDDDLADTIEGKLDNGLPDAETAAVRAEPI